jgi:hypothetical protein
MYERDAGGGGTGRMREVGRGSWHVVSVCAVGPVLSTLPSRLASEVGAILLAEAAGSAASCDTTHSCMILQQPISERTRGFASNGGPTIPGCSPFNHPSLPCLCCPSPSLSPPSPLLAPSHFSLSRDPPFAPLPHSPFLPLLLSLLSPLLPISPNLFTPILFRSEGGKERVRKMEDEREGGGRARKRGSEGTEVGPPERDKTDGPRGTE